MLHPDLHPRSNPEDRFDDWLDALVAGTPGDAASLDGADGPLGRAISGARQLHGLAARTTSVTAAQRRIEEDLMRSGTLAAPRGTTWIPIEKERRRTQWWSPASPAIAAALVVALIVALGASFIATQRPAPTDAPGFAMASPGAREPQDSELLIVDGNPSKELRSQYQHIGVIDEEGLTIIRPGEDDLSFPGVTSVDPNGVPGQAMVTRDDDSRSVVDLTTGETLFDLPDHYERQVRDSLAGVYLFVTESGENADWTVYDLRTGESRLLSEFIDLPTDQPAIPWQTDPFGTRSSAVVVMSVQTPVHDLSPDAVVPAFVIAGSLDRAMELDGYQPFSQFRTAPLVTSPDDTKVAWVDTVPENAIVIADTATGDALARFDLGTSSPDAFPAGFATDNEHLVVISHTRVLLLDWSEVDAEPRVLVEDLNGTSNALFYAPADTLYYHRDGSLLRMAIPGRTGTTVLDGIAAQDPASFTAPNSPWIVARAGDSIVLLDAHTGEVVSRLSDLPDATAPYDIIASNDGSTGIQGFEGSASGYLVSPRFPDGLVLTAPVDPEIIAATNSPDGIPVHYTPSPDGSSVVASTFDGVAIPRFVGRVGPDPEWVPIDETIDTLYWLPMPATGDAETGARTLPAQDFATPLATPPVAESESCATTPPNGDVPPGESADLDWLGSGTEKPSLWLMMTWDDGKIATEQIAGTYPVKLTFWRGEGSGEVDVTAIGPGGETIPAGTFEPFRGTTIPGIHPVGGMLPEPGCWTFTASDGNDTLTWTVDVQPLTATPAAASAPNGLIVVEGTASEARVENGVAIATLGDDGLTLPIGVGMSVSFPDVIQVNAIWGHPDLLHAIRADDTEAVIDLDAGAVLFELPEFENWARGTARWQFVPTDETLTDWTVTDATTGEVRTLSDLIDIPGDTPVNPVDAGPAPPNDTQVFQIELGKIEDLTFVVTDPAARTFAIAGSLDRVAVLPDYPTARANVGDPTLVANTDGNTVAYETRAGDSRVIVLDVASGKVLGRYSATEVGENPTLAGFDANGRVIVTDGTRVLALDPAGEVATVADGFERLDNPLVHAASGSIYARDVDLLYHLDLATGEATEVATGLVPGAFGFTTSDGDWIVAQTRDGHILVDARTGEVVSRMNAPANLAYIPDNVERRPGWVDGDGDTYILGVHALPVAPGVPTSRPTTWILSPDFPDGLEVTALDTARSYWLSPDGQTLYAYTSEQQSGPGTVWATPLGDEPDWQPVAEDVTPLPNPMMFFPEG